MLAHLLARTWTLLGVSIMYYNVSRTRLDLYRSIDNVHVPTDSADKVILMMMTCPLLVLVTCPVINDLNGPGPLNDRCPIMHCSDNEILEITLMISLATSSPVMNLARSISLQTSWVMTQSSVIYLTTTTIASETCVVQLI